MQNKRPSPIGQVPADWQIAHIRDIALKVGSGATPTGGADVYLPMRERYALVRSQNVFDRRFDPAGLVYISDHHAAELNGAEIRAGDVLLNITGDGITFGRSCLAPSDLLPACVNQHVTIIRPDSARCEPGYLLAFLTHPLCKQYIESFNAGGSRRAITKGHIESFQVPLPPLPEQRRIAHILGTLDDKIELNRKMNQTLEAMARALFKSWFVDFDPIRAKAEGRHPAGLDAATAALFPDSFQHSPLGKIPKGWDIGNVGEEFALTMGQSPPGETYNEVGDGLPFFQGSTDFGFRFPVRRVYCTQPTRFAAYGDTLVSVRAPVGDLNMATERCCIGRGVAAVRHKAGGRSFTYYMMGALAEEFAKFEADGTVFGSIGKADFHALRCIVPPSALAVRFESIGHSLDQMIENLDRESQTLVISRDTLLPRLLSGDLQVR